MEFNYSDLTKKEQKVYDSLTAESKKTFEKQWVKVKEEQNKLNATVARAREKERKARNHRLIELGAIVESVTGFPIDSKEDKEKFMEWLKNKNVQNFKNLF